MRSESHGAKVDTYIQPCDFLNSSKRVDCIYNLYNLNYYFFIFSSDYVNSSLNLGWISMHKLLQRLRGMFWRLIQNKIKTHLFFL